MLEDAAGRVQVPAWFTVTNGTVVHLLLSVAGDRREIPAQVLALDGCVNAAEFDGRAAGTLRCFVPTQADGSPVKHIVFGYRSEGWNVELDPASLQFHPVANAATGGPRYTSADFGPLASLAEAP